MTCAIMQPTYLPWLGYFDLIDQVNKFIFLDSVQLAKRSWQVRNRINTRQGELYLTIPLQKVKSRDETLISEAQLCTTENWKEKHLLSIEHAYKKSEYFSEVFPVILEVYNLPFAGLANFNITLIKVLAYKMGIRTEFYRSSEILSQSEFKKDQLLTQLCLHTGSTEYLSPVGSFNYIELESPGGAFMANKVQLYYHNYSHPEYRQGSKPFVPYMCILDLLFNEGFENSLAIIKKGRRHPYYYQQYRSLHELVQPVVH